MMIFSYVDVLHSATSILKRINSKGYDICQKTDQYRHNFAIFLRSSIACASIKSFHEEETFTNEINKTLKLFYSNDP